MAGRESLRRVREEDHGPLLSPHLRDGYEHDDYEFTDVTIGERIATGTLKANRFYRHKDDASYLSAPPATIRVCQLAIIYPCRGIGVPRKDREACLEALSLGCRKLIVGLDEVLIELEITSKEVRNERIHDRANFDRDAGSFIGTVSLFMPDEPLIESA